MEEPAVEEPARPSTGQAGRPQWSPRWTSPDGRPWPRRPARHWRRRRLGRWARGPWRAGPLRREEEGRLLGGVATGLALRTGLDVTVVRTVFVLSSLLSGFGVAAYVIAWLLVPATGERSSIAASALTDRRGITLAAGIASALVALMFIASVLGAGWLGSLAWWLVISTAGLVLIGRNASPGEQAALRRLAEPLRGLTGASQRGWPWLRAAVAAAMLAGGLAILLPGHPRNTLLRPLGGLVLALAGVVLALGPWWLRIARDLVLERQARARAEERADMAARVHDSVLQTLALIQRRADQPQRVIQLARAQERELRSWLFEGRSPGSPAEQTTSLAAGIRLIQQEVEAQHGVSVEAVTVGDCELDDDLRALLAAGREATVNAAKWSGAPVVSLFAEVEPGQISLFVRDRGRGFDPAMVPADRKGLAESVRARMMRRGGTASVRSGQGEGTEVSLTMPRATARQPERS